MASYTYKFRLYPNKEQEVLLSKHFGCCRFVYNYFLNERVDAYLNRKETLNYYDNAKELTKLKKDKTWLKEVNSQSLQFTLKCLEGAYGKFLARSAKFPKFKSKKGKQSFCVPQHGKAKNGRLYIVKFRKGIKIKQHRPIEGEIKHITVSRNSSGQYFACICVERVIEKLPLKTKAVRVDLGVKTLAVQSDGKTYPNIKSYRTLEDRLAKLQKWHPRTEKGSQHRERLRKRIAKLYQRIIDIRSDHLNKVSWEMVRDNGTIVLEDLNIKGMMQNHRLAKSVADVSLAGLVRMVKYKAA
jgi:putative transposase